MGFTLKQREACTGSNRAFAGVGKLIWNEVGTPDLRA